MADVPRAADVVVVGGGVHGASVAYHLARRKAGRVVLVERRFLASGPTGRSSALVRRFYAMDFLTRTGNASAHVFQRWAEAIGGGPGLPPGGHHVARGGGSGGEPPRERAARAGARRPRRPPDPGEAQALVPAMAVDDVALAAHEPESGYADASSTTNALAARARELGATIVQHVPVEAILVAGGRVTGVRTAAGEIHAPAVVVCAGLWAPGSSRRSASRCRSRPSVIRCASSGVRRASTGIPG